MMKYFILILCVLGISEISLSQSLPLTAGSGSPLTGELYLRKPEGFQNIIIQPTTTTAGAGIRFLNSGSDTYIFNDNSNGDYGPTNGFTPYATNVRVVGNRAFQIATNDILRYTIDGSGNNTWTGSGTFGGTVTSPLVFAASGSRVVLQANGINRVDATSTETGIYDESGTGVLYAKSGNIGVGTTTIPSGYKLAVNGKIITEAVKVQLNGSWPDYVFHKNYSLKPLSEIEKYVQANNHLPEIPSAKEAEKEGINLGEMSAKLLQKIEELTLYLIEQNKEMKEQGTKVKNLQQEISQFKFKP